MRPIQQALPGALAELLRDAPLSPGKVSFAWGAAVGPALARTTTARLEGRTLVVETSHPQWAQEVRRSSAVVLTRLQTLLGPESVSAITVRVTNQARL